MNTDKHRFLKFDESSFQSVISKSLNLIRVHLCLFVDKNPYFHAFSCLFVAKNN